MEGLRLSVLCILVVAVPADLAAQVVRGSPWAQDAPVYEHTSWYWGPADDGPRKPSFPRLTDIPPARMPDAATCIDEVRTKASVLAHDARTGVTQELPGAAFGPGGRVRGFRGFDGGQGWDGAWSRGFGCMQPVDDTSAYPDRISGVAVMRYLENGSDAWRWCSAAMQDAEVVLLAGHCVFNRDQGIMDYPEEVFFIPGWDGQGQHIPPESVLDPYGWAHGTYYLVGSPWVLEGNINYDMAAVVVDRAAGMLTGWFGREWDAPCQVTLNRSYSNQAYPGLKCGGYDGRQMQTWGGTFDSCPAGNKLQINFAGTECCEQTHGGMSGANAYFSDAGDLFAQAVNSHKSSTYARFIQMWEGFHTGLTTAIEDVARGSVLDIQPLDCNGPASALAGNVVVLNHLCTNPTNFDPPQQSYTFTWYLSDNEHITTADTPLSTRSVQLNLGSLALDPAGAMARVVTMPPVQIPANTPPGTYWLGVIYDPATDSVPGNNAATTWDAHQILISSSSP